MELTNITTYQTAHDLISDSLTLKEWQAIPAAIIDSLAVFDIEGGYIYHLINGETVAISDSVTGDIEGVYSLSDFINETLEYIKKGIEKE